MRLFMECLAAADIFAGFVLAFEWLTRPAVFRRR
jgi:hypothetical protein